MTTRGIPRLEFIYDKSFDESYKIDQLIKKSLG
jgi:ribosome-binding factor A